MTFTFHCYYYYWCYPWACMHAKLLQSCLTLWNPMDCSPPGSSVHGILQARILECIATPFSRGYSQPRDRTHISYVSCIAGGFCATELPGKAFAWYFYPIVDLMPVLPFVAVTPDGAVVHSIWLSSRVSFCGTSSPSVFVFLAVYPSGECGWGRLWKVPALCLVSACG